MIFKATRVSFLFSYLTHLFVVPLKWYQKIVVHFAHITQKKKTTDIRITLIKGTINNSMALISNTYTHTLLTALRASQGHIVALNRVHKWRDLAESRFAGWSGGADLIRRRRWDLFAEGHAILVVLEKQMPTPAYLPSTL